MRRTVVLATALLVGLIVLAAPARAQNQVVIGVLTCEGGQGIGLILGSKKTYACRYAPSNGAPPESYQASVTKIGLDIGVTGKTVIVWTVLASKPPAVPRALAGNYAGASADVALGIGGGAKVLVGGSAKSIVLQPLSLQGQTGLNLAVGIAGLTLR